MSEQLVALEYARAVQAAKEANEESAREAAESWAVFFAEHDQINVCFAGYPKDARAKAYARLKRGYHALITGAQGFVDLSPSEQADVVDEAGPAGIARHNELVSAMRCYTRLSATDRVA